jgi:ABC-type nickel/cobalt efflux system permease component RcnA
VQLNADGVKVDYQLNIDEFTIFRDVTILLNNDERAKLRGARDSHKAFASAIAPLIADRLEGWQNDKPLNFECTEIKEPKLEDHVRCEFVFVAKWPEPISGRQRFRLQDTYFDDKKGQVDLGFDANQGLVLSDKQEPDAALKARVNVERTTQEEQKLRSLAATITSSPLSPPARGARAEGTTATPTGDNTPPPTLWTDLRKRGLVAVTDSNLGLGLLLIISLVWGAIHALQPGHGKTLVAAYLVGERGTVNHALLLGLITTLSHTGAVLLLSVVILFVPNANMDKVNAGLAFIGGMLIIGMGVWLLLRRLAGQADHFHLFGGQHHHHDSDHHHHHHLPPERDGKVRFWDLLVLGISGGIVPCSDAVILLMAIIAKRSYWLGPPLVLAFSVGLAGTLVAIGIAVVKLKGFGASRWGKGRLIRALPIISAIVIIGLGGWLCWEALPK